MLTTIRSRIAIGAAAMLGLLALYTTAAPATLVAGNRPVIPQEIQVPQGNKLFLVMTAVGTQTYTCNGSGAWGPAVPAADLYDLNGFPVGKHSAGPKWEYQDGSFVLAKKVAGVSVAPGAIDWLLLRTVSTSPGPTGGDKLSGTTYVQRVITTGGLPPGGACGPDTTATVPYTAVYYFYRAAGTGEEVED